VNVFAANGGELVKMNWDPFSGANELLYNGSFVLERLTILPDGWFKENKDLLHPVIRQVFEEALARNSTAVDDFEDLHKQESYRRAVEDILTYAEVGNELTVMIIPTIPFHPTIEEVHRDPIRINSMLSMLLVLPMFWILRLLRYLVEHMRSRRQEKAEKSDCHLV
jgi:hypothetical protein